MLKDIILNARKEQHDNMMSYMQEFTANEFTPYVGIFWYDTENKKLFGVNKVESCELQFNKDGLKTTHKLHKQIWAKEYNKAKSSKVPSLFTSLDYTKVPRGRVFEIIDGSFEVMVGSWIADHSECKSLIIKEFELPETDTKFIIDSHWDVGNGWEGDK